MNDKIPCIPGAVHTWPLARLRPYARNAKTHDADQVARIAGSMAEFGWTVPCLVAADGELIAGHGRVLAAAQLGLAEAPVIVLGQLGHRRRLRSSLSIASTSKPSRARIAFPCQPRLTSLPADRRCGNPFLPGSSPAARRQIACPDGDRPPARQRCRHRPRAGWREYARGRACDPVRPPFVCCS